MLSNGINILVITVLLGIGGSLLGAVDMFIKIEGIPGESQDSVHKDEIDVLAWSWGMSNSSTFHDGSGGGTGRATFEDLELTKYIDKSTPLLMQSCSAGVPYPSAILTVRKAGEKPLEYIKIELTDVLVTSVSTGGSGGEDRLTENVTLNFRTFKVIYTEQNADGTGGATTEFGWDIAANAPG